MSTGFIWWIRIGIGHFYVYGSVFFCKDKIVGAGIAMRREKFEKMESFSTGGAHGRLCVKKYIKQQMHWIGYNSL